MEIPLKYGALASAALIFSLAISPAFAEAISKEKAASLISSKEFLSSDFPKFFKKKELKKALAIAELLLKKHPNDPLVLRYRALTLDKLGRRGEAISAYKETLASNPNHVPTRLFLGLAYARSGQLDEAARELEWVTEHSPSDDYLHWA